MVTNFRKLVYLLTFLIPFTALAYAAEHQAADSSKNAAAATQETQKGLAVQNIEHEGLSIQFRYEDKELVAMRIMNTSDKEMSIKVFHDDYMLGPGDYVIINPPSVKYFHISQKPVMHRKTTASNVFPNRFGKTYTYQTPESQGKLTTKSKD